METNGNSKQAVLIKKLQFLHSISQDISAMKPLPLLLGEIMESSKILMQAEASSLLLYDETTDKLNFQIATGEQGKLVKQFSIEMGKGIAGWVGQNVESLLIHDCYADSRFNPDYDKKSNFITKSMICVPLTRKGKLLGVMQVINKSDGSCFEKEDLALFETLAAQCAIAIENQQLTKKQIKAEALELELKTAREIQQHLLPDKLPDYNDLDIAAMIIPAREIGGDYYDVIKITEHISLFLIADVSGKGVPAALIVSIIVTCLKSSLHYRKNQFELQELVSTMNQVLIESTTSTKFVTAWFGIYNHLEKSLTSLNAGHNPPFLLRAGSNEFINLEKGGIFLGAMDLPFTSETITLEKDDLIVYFSDGVTEAWNVAEEDYGETRLEKTILKARNKPAAEILKIIYKDVKDYTGTAEQNDDITCGILKKI